MATFGLHQTKLSDQLLQQLSVLKRQKRDGSYYRHRLRVCLSAAIRFVCGKSVPIYSKNQEGRFNLLKIEPLFKSFHSRPRSQSSMQRLDLTNTDRQWGLSRSHKLLNYQVAGVYHLQKMVVSRYACADIGDKRGYGKGWARVEQRCYTKNVPRNGTNCFINFRDTVNLP